jgi:hypothetical protein
MAWEETVAGERKAIQSFRSAPLQPSAEWKTLLVRAMRPEAKASGYLDGGWKLVGAEPIHADDGTVGMNGVPGWKADPSLRSG